MRDKPGTGETVPPDGTVRDDAECAITTIAQRHLRLDTLETRSSDALDFHELAVWSIREALLAAYEAGASAASHTTKGSQP